MIDTNCTGLVQVTRAFLPGMVARNRGHIFNLGHGILPETPPENAKFMVECVHRLSARG